MSFFGLFGNKKPTQKQISYCTDVLIPGWTSQFLTQIFSLFVLVLCTVTIVLILILSLRMQPPMVPYHDHGRFIYEISRIFPPDDEGQT